MCVCHDVSWCSCHAFPPHWVSLLYRLSVKLQRWPSLPLPPLSARSAQVCTIMCAEAEACICEWGCLPLHLFPISIAGILWSAEDSSLQLSCHSPSSFSIIPTSVSAASSPSLKASISHTHPQHCPAAHTPFLSNLLLLRRLCVKQDCRQSHPRVVYPAASPSSLLLGWASHRDSPPSPVLFTIICSPTHRSEKSRQAVSSSRQSVFWLGSWSSTVPLEDDPVDEDGGDGPGGVVGETEDRHPKHRWVIKTHPIQTTVVFLCYSCLNHRFDGFRWGIVSTCQ